VSDNEVIIVGNGGGTNIIKGLNTFSFQSGDEIGVIIDTKMQTIEWTKFSQSIAEGNFNKLKFPCHLCIWTCTIGEETEILG